MSRIEEIPSSRRLSCRKVLTKTTQGAERSLEMLQGRIPQGRTCHLPQMGPAPSPLHWFWDLAVALQSKEA